MPRVPAVVAELRPTEGRLGVPHIRTELMALAAPTVGTWATATTKSKQSAGKLLQQHAGVNIGHIIPHANSAEPKLHGDIWTTGKPIVETGLAPEMPQGTSEDSTADIRREMRLKNGMKTTWGKMGLVCEFGAQILGRMTEALIHQTVPDLPYKRLAPRDATGAVRKWSAYRRLTE
ncbi:hypothetical protein DVH05_001495 [Phytophthora capsici]|nr:hypothetical protein DVH05_001495 [Phytophthora capsici]